MNLDPTIDNYQPGTYYIMVQTYTYPGDFVISAELFDIGTLDSLPKIV